MTSATTPVADQIGRIARRSAAVAYRLHLQGHKVDGEGILWEQINAGWSDGSLTSKRSERDIIAMAKGEMLETFRALLKYGEHQRGEA